MTNNKVVDFLKNKLLNDFNNHLNLENKFIVELGKLERLKLTNTKQYRDMVRIKTTQSYFVAYLYRIIESYGSDVECLVQDFSITRNKIKGKIQLWKKTDFKNIRKMRKDIGDSGVNLMKNSVEETISKIDFYLENLKKLVKDL
tara:strand:+ start:202 stop:633 length:432 start_codon:yes stop_codon:yes gene_type:complete